MSQGWTELSPKIFVSGAPGFIGGAIARLAALGGSVYGGVRSRRALGPGITPFITGDLAETRFGLPDMDVVIHAAGLGHRPGAKAADYQRQNVQATLNLARAAKLAGAKRFILISSAYVLGRAAALPVDERAAPAPADEYARSKLEAEQAAQEIFGPALSILRPAAVIGPGAPGNILLLLQALRRGLPLPFAALTNQRSFIGVGDLAALALMLATAPDAPPLLLAAHPTPLTPPALVRALAAGLGVRARLFPAPAAMLASAATLLGRACAWQSLSQNFIAVPRAALAMGWKPAESLAETLAATSRYYNTTQNPP